MKKVRMVCSECGSENVVVDAYASWNFDTQEWEVASTHDKGSYCEDCDDEVYIDSKEVETD